jgi:hypothetical protein
LFWADNFQGEVRMTNVLIHGGGRGIDDDIRATGATLIVDKWVNVRAAAIVDGVIVTGASLPSP